MSVLSDYLYHPPDMERVEMYEGFSWPCFFFGPLWFIAKGLSGWFLMALLLGPVTLGMSALILPFYANKLNNAHLRRNGWLTLDQLKSASANELNT